MPELPEVQTIVDALVREGLPGATITAASVHWPRTIANGTPAACSINSCCTSKSRSTNQRHLDMAGS